MPVEFRVLGPLEIRRDGAPVRLRASKQRTFLAVLLVNHGRVVSVDRLIEDIWQESPPTGALQALQTHAWRLRALLGEDLPIVARAPGYVLEVDPQAIDSVRFEQLLDEARQSDPARAAARAADALALWRGDALADFAFDSFAQEEIARLEELRLEAEETRIDAELALGRAAELVGELEALVAAAPLRERRRGQLMLALYRAGRQADALAAFRDAREHLLDELGLEPGDDLRALERAILQQDPALAAGAVVRTAAPAARRLVSVVAVEPEISLELDPEEHERQTKQAADVVARVAGHFDAQLAESFVLAFSQEDHVERAQAAASELGAALRAGIGVESGEALLGNGGVGGPLVERARRRARAGAAPATAAPLERRADGPFVGRHDELERLRNARAALVVGPPGIGKSRLARELAREQRVVVGRCSSYGTEALAPLCDVAAELGDASALDEVPAAEVPLTFRRLCERSGPLVVVIDDAHWADPLVLETIEHVVAQSESARVLCLAREELLEERPGFLPTAERLPLRPLSPGDAAMLAGELGAEDSSIVERAEGNPLFIEQLLAHAAESAGALPTTLQALLAARLDRLAPSERLAIERAAVVGREFDAELVGELLESPNSRPALASLVRRGLVDPISPDAAFVERFRFRHALIHEATYESTAKAERARLHEAVADLLAARAASDEVVGFHLERAAELRPERDRHTERLAEDAGRRLGRAGIASSKRGDARSGARLLGRAVRLLPRQDSERRELLCELGLGLVGSGESQAGSDVFAETIALAQQLGDRRVEYRARIELAMMNVIGDDGNAAAELLDLVAAAEPVFAAVGDDRALGRAFMLDGWVRGGGFARHREWEEGAERALEHYRRAGWPVSTCIGHIAAAAYHGPAPASAGIARCTELLEVDVEDLAGEANVAAYLAGFEAMRREFEAADTLLERARTIYTELGRLPAIDRVCAPIEAAVARLRGDDDGAIAALEQSCAALSAAHDAFYIATQAAELAELLAAAGRTKEAAEFLAEATRHARADDVISQLWLGVAATRLAAAKGAADEAVTAGRAAVDLGAGTDALNLRAATHLALADVLDGGDADAQREAAAALYAEKENAAATDRLGRS